MNKKRLKLTYYDTYYIAKVINNMLWEPDAYEVRLSRYWNEEDENVYTEPFPKYSLFHKFIEQVTVDLIYEEHHSLDVDVLKKNINLFGKKERLLPIDHLFEQYGFEEYEPFYESIRGVKSFSEINEDDLCDFYLAVLECGQLEMLTDRLAEEVFHVLFANRSVLQNFNCIVSQKILNLSGEYLEEGKCSLTKRGTLKRVYIPKWAKDAVFFRDRGRCVLCNVDLSGLLSRQNELQYDHIVPLVKGGANDVSNLQLLCSECNQVKGGKTVDTSIKYEKWY